MIQSSMYTQWPRRSQLKLFLFKKTKLEIIQICTNFCIDDRLPMNNYGEILITVIRSFVSSLWRCCFDPTNSKYMKIEKYYAINAIQLKWAHFLIEAEFNDFVCWIRLFYQSARNNNQFSDIIGKDTSFHGITVILCKMYVIVFALNWKI